MAWTPGSEIEREVVTQGETGAIVNGAFVSLEAGTELATEVMRLATDAGYQKFRVFLNGEEIEPTEAPDLIEEGDVLKIMAFDVAG